MIESDSTSSSEKIGASVADAAKRAWHATKEKTGDVLQTERALKRIGCKFNLD